MKRLLVATAVAVALFAPAQAADMRARPLPVKAPPAMAPAVYSWTGWYIGAHIGGGWGTSDWTDVTYTLGLNDANPHPNGFIGGGQIGVNYQINQFVLGVEQTSAERP